MSWNLNSLAKDNFRRIHLIEAHNALFKYDLISIRETSLNDSVELPENLIDDYTFVPANNPANVRHGGDDLSFDESIVIEIKFGRKKMFLLSYIEVLLLTIPRLNSKSFCQILKNCIQKFNVKTLLQHFTLAILMHTQLCWPDGDTNPEGVEIENLFTSLGLSQIISEPTNFEPNKNPSYRSYCN